MWPSTIPAKSKIKRSLYKRAASIWPTLSIRLEAFSTVWERQASTLHTKQSAMHGNKLINSQLSSPLPPSANSTACLTARSCSLKAQDEICVKLGKWTEMRGKSNAITCAGVILMEIFCYHQRKYFYQWQRGHIGCFMLTTWNQTKAFGEKETTKHRHGYNATAQKQTALTSICWPTSSFLIDREEKVAFAICPHNPRARRIFTSQTVSLLLIFQRSESPCPVSRSNLMTFLLKRHVQKAH